MRTSNAPTIRLKNYTPPQYSISKVDLDFSLSAKKTVVRSRLEVERIAGTPASEPLVLDGDELTLHSLSINGTLAKETNFEATEAELKISVLPSENRFTLEIETHLDPASNTKLMGLYQSSGVFCTQCEAEGFRRITYFPDRPDMLAVYTVRLEAEQSQCGSLLSNGNLLEQGTLGNGRHFAVWHDPHPKPSYLFALVAGNLDALSDTFTTASGKHVDLNIYVEKGKAPLAEYAMDSLKRSMIWDEEKYGCEYDLDVFNIVAVSDFNMGAMENKGLNVFNDKYVLAHPDIATDSDYANIEAIIAHEYFHNWTGNRITCRDWFQLCLKEGLTVYRDQEFSADQRSRAVQRIHQVRVLKAGQFKEDSGPLAHPVRPSAYKEINNFYTATVYQKGAELVRMLATFVGPKIYRKATDLYFVRHDGDAATMEDFIACFEEASGRNFSQFLRWYEQAGTPDISVREEWEESSGKYTLNISQTTPPTPGQKSKKPVPIPIRFGLIGKNGEEIAPRTDNPCVHDDVISVTEEDTTVVFDNMREKPVASLLRGFSAPVELSFNESPEDKLHRAKFDKDLYNRWEAVNGYLLAELVKESNSTDAPSFAQDLIHTLVGLVLDSGIDPAFRALALTLPSVGEVAREIGNEVDPQAINSARNALLTNIANVLGRDGLELFKKLDGQITEAMPLQAVAMRSLKNAILLTSVAGSLPGSVEAAQEQFYSASNMTDRISALSTLLHQQDDVGLAETVSEQFYNRFADNPLVLNSWFSIHAMTPGRTGLQKVQELLNHPKFTLNNPNRARSLLGPFAAGNLTAFHQTDGAGYALFLEQIRLLDAINPQIAARLLTSMGDWRMYSKQCVIQAEHHLTELAKTTGLSTDVQEIVERTLG